MPLTQYGPNDYVPPADQYWGLKNMGWTDADIIGRFGPDNPISRIAAIEARNAAAGAGSFSAATMNRSRDIVVTNPDTGRAMTARVINPDAPPTPFPARRQTSRARTNTQPAAPQRQPADRALPDSALPETQTLSERLLPQAPVDVAAAERAARLNPSVAIPFTPDPVDPVAAAERAARLNPSVAIPQMSPADRALPDSALPQTQALAARRDYAALEPVLDTSEYSAARMQRPTRPLPDSALPETQALVQWDGPTAAAMAEDPTLAATGSPAPLPSYYAPGVSPSMMTREELRDMYVNQGDASIPTFRSNGGWSLWDIIAGIGSYR